MFKHFSKNFNNLQSAKYRINPLSSTNLNRHASKPFFLKLSKKFFTEGNPLNALLPVTRAIVLGNCIMFGMSWFYSQRDFITKFYYNIHSLERGKFHTALTSQFVKNGTLDFVIDTFIIGMIGNNIEMMIGTQLLQRLAFASVIGSILLVHLSGKNEDFYKPDTFIRLVIYIFTLRDPHQHIYFFPLPLKLKIMYLAGFVFLMDLISGKYCNFAPLIACIAMNKGKGGF